MCRLNRKNTLIYVYATPSHTHVRVQLDAPSADHVPAPHAVHVVLEVALAVAEKVPATQAERTNAHIQT